MDSRRSNEIRARRRAEDTPVDTKGIPQTDDPVVLANIINRNRATINQGWQQLEKLNQRLESIGPKDAVFTPEI